MRRRRLPVKQGGRQRKGAAGSGTRDINVAGRYRGPAEHYGPWESIAGLLTEGLVARGVDVTLFATLDSVTAAALDGVCPHGYAEDAQLDGRVWEALHVSHALARSGEFELVHNHLDWLPLAFGDHAQAPMVTTIHGFSGAGILPAYTRSRPRYRGGRDLMRGGPCAVPLPLLISLTHQVQARAAAAASGGGAGDRAAGHRPGRPL